MCTSAEFLMIYQINWNGNLVSLVGALNTFIIQIQSKASYFFFKYDEKLIKKLIKIALGRGSTPPPLLISCVVIKIKKRPNDVF